MRTGRGRGRPHDSRPGGRRYNKDPRYKKDLRYTKLGVPLDFGGEFGGGLEEVEVAAFVSL